MSTVALMEWAYYPTRFMDKSWLARCKQGDLLEKLLSHAAGNPKVEALVNERIARTFGLEVESAPGKTKVPGRQEESWLRQVARTPELARLCLLNASQLKRVILGLGACCNYTMISHAIMKEEVMALERIIGKEVHEFCLRQPTDLLKAWQATTNDDISEDNLEGYFIACGMHCYQRYSRRLHAGIRKRLQLMLPTDWVTCWPRKFSVHIEGTHDNLIHEIIKEVIDHGNESAE